MRKFLIYLLLSIILFIGCDKYRDGPMISFRTKSARFCQKWEIIRVEHQNGVVDDYNAEIQFNKDGTYTNYYWDLDDNLHVLNGTWTWMNDKEWMEMDFSEFNDNYPYIIPTLPFSSPTQSGKRQFDIHTLKYQELVIEDIKTEALLYFVRVQTEE